MINKPDWVNRRISKRKFIVALSASIVLLVASGAFATWGYVQLQDAKAHLAASTAYAADLKVELERKQAADAITQAANREAEKKQRQDELMAASGFEATNINNVYYRWAKPSEFTCGYWDCAYIYVTVLDTGCPNGLYAEAAIMSGTLAVGMTNGVTTGLHNGDTAAILFEDYVGGDSFKLTKISCN